MKLSEEMIMKKALLMVLVATMVFAISGCKKKETAGDKLDGFMKSAQKSADSAKKSAENAVEEAKEATK